jgi:hypothetical protein
MYKIQSEKFKYPLRGTNSLTMTLLECSNEGCSSHIIFKIHRNMYNKMYFQVHYFNGTHQHTHSKVYSTDAAYQKLIKPKW